MKKKKHLHIVCKISYRGKKDSVDVECFCGHKDCLAVWYFWDGKCNPGWDKKMWDETGVAIDSFLSLVSAGVVRYRKAP